MAHNQKSTPKFDKRGVCNKGHRGGKKIQTLMNVEPKFISDPSVSDLTDYRNVIHISDDICLHPIIFQARI